ncbi:MAG TPA: response regulator [Ferrovibrio sp.]|uniref:response regulator n=1 Tax=Ferrovibrio sp. TaxID=1917215 RepID=UPI002ED3F498
MVKILVVEDSRTQAEKLKFFLEDAGHEVTVAGDAAEAISMFPTGRFDIVISDIVMPGQSGYDLCRTLKASRGGRDVPFILLSSLSDPMDIIRGLECGADNFLTKPYDPDTLLGRISTAVQNRRLRHESKIKLGVEVFFLGQAFTITSDKEQILDLLISTFEDIVRTNHQLRASQSQLAEAKAQIEGHARHLEQVVQQRTTALEEVNRSLENEIADRSRMADSLRESNALLSAVISSSPLPIYVLDTDGNVSLWSAAAQKAFGWSVNEVLGKPPPFIEEANRHAFLRDFVKAAVTRDFEGSEIAGRTRDGKAIALRISGASLVGDPDFPHSVVHVAEDITERKLIDRQLVHAQKMEAVGQLTGGVAHDFNNLLGVVMGNLDMIAEMFPQKSDVQGMIDAAMQACQRGATLTRQLLAFSRRQSLNAELIDASTAVSEMSKLLSTALGENITLNLVATAEPCLIMADRAQFESAIMNLAVNAAHAMSAGGTLTVETKVLTLGDDYASAHAEMEPGEYVLLEITDTGSGIPPEILDRVFEPFFTTKPEGKGTGLGLSQVFGFVRQSGGNVNIYSEVGVGTTVRVYFPRAANAGGRRPGVQAEAEHQAERGSEAILLVEDNAGMRQTLVAQLKNLGYQVVDAANAETALEMLAGGAHFDLLFTDIVMPGSMSGLELARLVGQRYPKLKVLVSSGFPGAAISGSMGLPAGAQFLNKPYRYKDLAKKIREVLQA